MDKKIIVIASGQDFLYQNISNNLDSSLYEVKIFKDGNSIDAFLKDPFKIDALIIEDIVSNANILSIYARNVFVFSDLGVKHQILLRKPLMLSLFLQEVKNGAQSKKAFLFVDGNIYCEVRSSFTIQSGSVIRLSHTENAALKHILLAKDYYLSKESLQQNVWKYSKDAETTTIEQSMKRLGSVLPEGVLRPFEEGYKIFAEKIY